MDGRLDNRRELLARFRRPDHDSDAVLLSLAAGSRDRGLAAVVGDYALCRWNELEERLVLARDPFGTRRMFWGYRRRRLAWGSDIGLVRDLLGESEIDETWIAAYLLERPTFVETPYRGIASAEPGTVLTWQRGETKIRRFWEYPVEAERPQRSDADAEAEFRELLQSAVRCRVSGGPKLAELSGGLDSSSIVCVADDLAPDLATRVHTMSWIQPAGSTDDDDTYRQLVEERRGRPSIAIPVADYPMLSELPTDFADVPAAQVWNASWHRRISEIAESVGTVDVISGLGGDDLLFGNSPLPADAIDAFESRSVSLSVQRCASWARARHESMLAYLWRCMLRPLLDFHLRGKESWGALLPPPLWLAPELLDTVEGDQRSLEAVLGGCEASTLARAMHYSHCRIIDGTIAHGTYRGATRHLRPTFPFRHLPLVEFCFRLPIDQLIRPGEQRSLLRRSMRGVLPEEVRKRTSKGSHVETVFPAIRRRRQDLKSLLERGEAARRGWIDGAAAGKEVDDFVTGKQQGVSRMIRLVAVELWLRGLPSQ